MLGSSLRALLYELRESLVLGNSPLSEGGDSVEDEVTDIHEKDKNEDKKDKTEHGMEKHVPVKIKVKVKVNQKVNLNKVKVKAKAKAKTKEIFNGPTRTQLMG
ncbi:hypothetical protein Tco_1526548 [Tanacetum coccineum]